MSAYNVGDPGSIPGLGRSPAKEMATHSSTLAWKIPKKGNAKECSTTAQLHSSHTLVMLKILQARLQQYVNRELPDVQAGFRKGRGTKVQISTFTAAWKKLFFQKNIYFCFIDYAKTFDCLDQNKLENSESV